MLSVDYPANPNYTISDPKLLYIDRRGNVYPDCKTYKTPAICTIYDQDAIETIFSSIFEIKDERLFNMITIETSGACQADCFYCFQRGNRFGDQRENYWEALYKIVCALETRWLFFSGGEILIQEDAIRFVRRCRKAKADTWFHLKSNGCVDESVASLVEELFNSIMVSFNGFSRLSYETIMKVDFDTTVRFCETIKRTTSVNLGVKFLNSPLVVNEIPSFLEWALNLRVQCLALQTAYNYEVFSDGSSKRCESTFGEIQNSSYWHYVFERTADACNRVIKRFEDSISNNCNYITADKEFLQTLRLSADCVKLMRTDGVYIIE